MNSKLLSVKRLGEAAAKAAARVAAAKDDLKTVKSRLKQARRVLKAEKKAAKQLRRKLKQAAAATLVRRAKPAASPKPKAPLRKKPALTQGAVKRAKPRRTPKPREKPAPDTMRSAAEVAKSVIERLHAPPPLLPPEPVIPANAVPGDSVKT
jgi:hypothetical protein